MCIDSKAANQSICDKTGATVAHPWGSPRQGLPATLAVAGQNSDRLCASNLHILGSRELGSISRWAAALLLLSRRGQLLQLHRLQLAHL